MSWNCPKCKKEYKGFLRREDTQMKVPGKTGGSVPVASMGLRAAEAFCSCGYQGTITKSGWKT